MEVYESPKMEVIAFDNEDVITTSCIDCTTFDCPNDN
jgi:hypothetical protein